MNSIFFPTLARWSPHRVKNRWIETAATALWSLWVVTSGPVQAEEPRAQLAFPGRAAAAAPEVHRQPIGAVHAVKLAETPSAAVVLAQSPLLEKPAPAALAEMEKRSVRPRLDDNINREAVRDSYRHYDKPFTPEEAGSAFKYLRRKPTLRGLWELFDPTSPVAKPELPAATAFENRRRLGEPPRAFVDPTGHELSIRLF